LDWSNWKQRLPVIIAAPALLISLSIFVPGDEMVE
jgi:hypothetical protein